MAKAGPRHHAAHKTVAFWHGEKGIDHLAIHQPKIARIGRDGDIGDSIDEAIKRASGPAFESRLALAFRAEAISDIHPFAPVLEHFENDVGRVLQIRVDDDHGIAYCILQAGGYGDLVAEIARQGEHAHALIPALQPPQKFQRGISAAIIDINEFKVEFGNFLKRGD